jgi:AsmA protein
MPDGGGEVWSDAPIALPLPLPIDLAVRVRGEGLKADKLEVGAFDARVEADRRQALVTLAGLQTYGGKVSGKVRAEPASSPSYAVDLDADGIGILAASQALTDLSRFDGRAQVGLAVSSSGASLRDLVHGLSGDGRVILRDGAVIGINVAAMLRQIMTLGLNAGARSEQRTDFAEAGSSFKIANGVLRTDDLHLRAPVLRLEGAGAVDLPPMTVNFRIVPRLASTLQGQGARGEPVFQAGVPFLVQGPYTAPAIRFDLNGTLTSAISSPADVAWLAADLAKSPEMAQVLRQRFDVFDQLPSPAAGKALEAVKGVLGKGGDSAKGRQRSPGPADLGKAARGLLQGLGGR